MIHLGSIRGTTISVDFSFIIIVGLFVASNYNQAAGIQYALLWIPVLFLSLLVHEFAHAAAIGVFGYGPSEIVLGGMGGATMNRRKARPWHDLVISLAGPVASFLLAWGVRLIFLNVPYTRQDPMLVALIPLLYDANMLWGKFNLLPISPLDGGHAVRNFFRMFLSEKTAFTIAVWIGMLAGAAVIVFAILIKSLFLAFIIGWFVFINFQQWQSSREHGTPGD